MVPVLERSGFLLPAVACSLADSHVDSVLSKWLIVSIAELKFFKIFSDPSNP